MKKCYIILLVSAHVFLAYAKKDTASGKSFLFTRPGYFHLSMQNQLWQEYMYHKHGTCLASAQIIPFYQQSIKLKKVERYFLINQKNQLLVSGDNNISEKNERDVRAEWVNLSPDFRGLLSIDPTQQQAGFICEFNQDLRKFTDIDLFQRWYVAVSIPFVAVTNDIHLTQCDVKGASPVSTQMNKPQNIIEAFAQPSWLFGKMEGQSSRVGFAEIKLSLGSHALAKDYFIISYHSALTLPTNSSQNPEQLFSPVVGNNRHVGIGGGVNFQVPLNYDTSAQAFCFFLSLETTFLVRNRQFRTFGLKEKPWSRFMLYNKKGGVPNQNIPGVNLLTREAIIRPYGQFDFSAGLRMLSDCYSIELGYNIWGHDKEDVDRLTCIFKEDFGIAAEQDASATVAATAHDSTIDNLSPTDTNPDGSDAFIPVTLDELSFESASTASAINHKAHASFGYKNTGKKMDGFIGFGFFVDVPQKNTALKLWGVWGKIGASF